MNWDEAYKILEKELGRKPQSEEVQERMLNDCGFNFHTEKPLYAEEKPSFVCAPENCWECDLCEYIYG